MTSADDERPAERRGDPSHPDLDTLALLSLGETASEDVAAHVAGCSRCRAEVQSLAPVADLARTLQPGDLLAMQPPPQVWERIVADVGLESPEAEPSSPPRGQVSQADEPAEPPARRRVQWLLAAAVIGAIVGATAPASWNALHDDSSSRQPAVVSSAQLKPLAAKSGRGTAEITTTADGRELSVQVQAASPHHAFLEVWLMSDPEHLVALGTLDAKSGSFAVPAGINLKKYSIVDVSIEPYDGNPAHSSDSLVRGTLAPS